MRFALLPILACALVFPACAAHEASARSAQVEDLKAELQRLRARSESMESRLEALENKDALRTAVAQAAQVQAQANAETPRETGGAPASRAPSSRASNASDALPDVPDLTVVKLTPSHKRAPPIDTRTDVVEPDPEVLDALATRADAPAPEGSSEGVQALYQSGLQALRTGNLQGGVRTLTDFAEAHPKDPLADNALYFAGIGDIGLQDYDKASDAFASVIARYPAGDAVAEAMLKLADCRVHLHQRDEAKSLFARVISTYPGTAAASLAEQRLASLSP